jgi:tetratricopeptide (TPR) repeat protein
MKTPYEILGVNPNASDDEIKKAYRNLARKYHPDKYRDSDLADLASEKMKEVNAAYEEIKKMRETSGGRAGGGSGGYSYGGGQSSTGDPQFSEIRRMINTGNIGRAEQLLYGMSEYARNGEWNFLKGCVLAQRGAYYEAVRYYETACYLDPHNGEYRRALDMMRSRGASHGQPYRTSGSSDTACDCCSSLICADCCCECMGGDLIRCC